MLINKPIFIGMPDTVFLLNGARKAVHANPTPYGLLDGRAKGGE